VDRRQRLDSLADVTPNQGSFGGSLLPRLVLEGLVEVLLDHDLEPFHKHRLQQFAEVM
jgi:hypothetical protein